MVFAATWMARKRCGGRSFIVTTWRYEAFKERLDIMREGLFYGYKTEKFRQANRKEAVWQVIMRFLFHVLKNMQLVHMLTFLSYGLRLSDRERIWV